MCERCAAASGSIRFAETAVDAVGALRFRREQTPAELEFGDIPRLARDIDAAEIAVADGAKDATRAIVRSLVADALAAVRSHDMGALSRLTVDTADLAAAIRAGSADAIATGKRQVFDQYRKQTGRADMALPPKKRPRLTKEYLNARAEVAASNLAARATATAAQLSILQAARGAVDHEALETAVEAAAESALTAIAREIAREGISVGRYLAAEDTSDAIDYVLYTAILDDRVCDSCEALDDGTEYDTLEDAPEAPNPDCEGGANCRCAIVIVYKR